MSVSTTKTSQSFSTGGGVTTFPITEFPFLDADELLVVRNTAGVPTTLVKDTDYTVSGGNNSTGSITTPSAIAAGSTLIVTRVTKKTQLTSYTTGDRFPATTHERALDKLTMLVQEATANNLPATATASGTAPYVLQAASAGATPSWVPQSAGGIAAGSITNTMLAGGITPSKLSTGGPVWDASGNLTATSFVGNITGSITGNAATATRLATPRTIGLSGDVTGTASFDGSANATIAATIASVGTSQIANNSVTAAKLGSTERLQICKAWVNFNGTGTPSIRSSYNTSSITKNGTGDYTVNYSTAMADANYSITITTVGLSNTASSINGVVKGASTSGASNKTSSAVSILTGPTSSNGVFDVAEVNVAIFGN